MRERKRPVIQRVVCSYHKRRSHRKAVKAVCTCMVMYKLEVRDEKRRG